MLHSARDLVATLNHFRVLCARAVDRSGYDR
jgi:hypothetical protein